MLSWFRKQPKIAEQATTKERPQPVLPQIVIDRMAGIKDRQLAHARAQLDEAEKYFRPLTRPKTLDLLVTLWPSMPHFKRFAMDNRLAGIRLNSAMTHLYDLDAEIKTAMSLDNPVPLWFDLKGRQLRVTEADIKSDHLEIVLNHPIECPTPFPVLFKAGEDDAHCLEVKDHGYRLVFDGGPRYLVHPGESIHIRHPQLVVNGPTFTDAEIKRIQQVAKGGFNHFFLSYVESQRDVDAFREYVGQVPIILKIENKVGLDYVANKWKKRDNEWLMAARGDLFVEVDKPHDIMKAMKLIIERDPEGYAGSRMLLSMVKKPVPDMADLGDLAWMYEIGYRRLMLCDELCLKEELLSPAVNAFDAFRRSYVK